MGNGMQALINLRNQCNQINHQTLRIKKGKLVTAKASFIGRIVAYIEYKLGLTTKRIDKLAEQCLSDDGLKGRDAVAGMTDRFYAIAHKRLTGRAVCHVLDNVIRSLSNDFRIAIDGNG